MSEDTIPKLLNNVGGLLHGSNSLHRLRAPTSLFGVKSNTRLTFPCNIALPYSSDLPLRGPVDYRYKRYYKMKNIITSLKYLDFISIQYFVKFVYKSLSKDRPFVNDKRYNVFVKVLHYPILNLS
jgi:hypothetical protein